MLEATQKILDVTSESQKVTVIGQIDAANKRLRAFKSELEKLTDPNRKFAVRVAHYLVEAYHRFSLLMIWIRIMKQRS